MNRIVTRLSLPGIFLAAVVLHGCATREPESAPELEPEVMLEPLEETEPERALPEPALPPLETLVLLPAPQQLRYEPGQYAPDTLAPDIELRPPAIPR